MDTLHETPAASQEAHLSTQTYRVSFFNNKNDNNPQAYEYTWLELCDLLSKRDLRPEKDGPLFSGTIYYPASTRSNENVRFVTLAVLDFDKDILPEDVKQLCARLNDGKGVAALLYSTYGHTPENPKFRLVILLRSPVPGSQWSEVWPRLALAFDGKSDDKAKDASRMFYMPSCPQESGEDAFFLILEGIPLDITTLPEAEVMKEKVTQDLVNEFHDPYALKAFKNQVQRVLEAKEGTRNQTLNNSALALGHFVGAGRLKRSEVEKKLLNVARKAGLEEEEILPTIKSGLEKGITDPNFKGMNHQSMMVDKIMENPVVESMEEIPRPTDVDRNGAPKYSGNQIKGLLYPHWDCVSLSTNAGHAYRIAEFLGQDLRFASQLGWLLYNGYYWERDDKNATQTKVKVAALSRQLRDEAQVLYGIAQHLLQLGRTQDAAAMGRAAEAHLKTDGVAEDYKYVKESLGFAAGNPRIRVQPDVFDQKPYVIGFKNGVWDCGLWREPRREDYILNPSPVEIDFDTDQSECLNVLNCITGGDEEFAYSLQEYAGYVLSGASNLRVLPWLYGPKGTGKSTFAEMLQTLLGEMSATIDPKKFASNSARERLGADLWNKRLAICAEAGSQQLESELLKTLSGADMLPVRLLYSEAFNAKPTHVLLMVSNDAPDLNAYDDALKDRVMALPFVHPLAAHGQIRLTGGDRIETVRKDPTSPLMKGFAVWALEGLARVYQTQAIFLAPCIKEATQKFWADTDPLTRFWEDISEERLRAGIPTGMLQDECDVFCEAEGIKPLRGKNLGAACKNRGLKSELIGSSQNRRRCWILRGKPEQKPSSGKSPGYAQNSSGEFQQAHISHVEDNVDSSHSQEGCHNADVNNGLPERAYHTKSSIEEFQREFDM